MLGWLIFPTWNIAIYNSEQIRAKTNFEYPQTNMK